MRCRTALVFLAIVALSSASSLTLVNNCGYTVSVCGRYLGHVFDMPAHTRRNVAASGNPPYNQCGSVQAECEFNFLDIRDSPSSVNFNGWGNQDCYDLSEIAVRFHGAPVTIFGQNGGPTVKCTGHPCRDAYQFPADNSKNHCVRGGGHYTLQWRTSRVSYSTYGLMMYVPVTIALLIISWIGVNQCLRDPEFHPNCGLRVNKRVSCCFITSAQLHCMDTRILIASVLLFEGEIYDEGMNWSSLDRTTESSGRNFEVGERGISKFQFHCNESTLEFPGSEAIPRSHKEENGLKDSTMNKTCGTCRGSGLIQSKCTPCTSCYGKKCIQCRETGYNSMPYEECQACVGSGTISEPHKNPKQVDVK
ncbi:hypothetical protein PROFUN_12183 [Planoprotostelium fungivorum]|uniref:Uncharacterized protein n=1 Tax=Planoprotostelium fungivorum TaxID=1890364 RepID=A0A2P6N8G3_9EUKA|nr:hypothetical protein PROFUN_12183 [Planoprotostelium fungivorum]